MFNIFSNTKRIVFTGAVASFFVFSSSAQVYTAKDDPVGDNLQTVDNIDDFNDAQWWRRFNDPLLDSLITKGVENNYNVSMAAKRINVAKYSLMSTRSAYYPTVDVNVGWSADRISGTTSSRYGAAANSSYFDADLSLSWEIDLFGRVQSKTKQNKAQIKVSRADYEATMVSLRAQIATAYFQLRMYQKELEIAKRHSESQDKVVKITETRHEVGLASMVDVSQARMVYYSTLASIPQLENSIHTSINSIAVLIGENPQNLYPLLEQPRELPDCNQLIPSSIPMNAIERRPDVMEAKYNIDVAAAEIGIAKKDYLPMLTLTGTIGTEAHDIGDLFQKNSLIYSIVPTLSWTVFEGFSRKANVASAKENMEIEIDNYNLTLTTAFQEADNALNSYLSNIKYMKNIEDVIENSKRADELSLDLYKRGLGTFTNVMDAIMSLLEYENEYVEAQGNALNSLVSLYKALGGGWQNNID